MISLANKKKSVAAKAMPARRKISPFEIILYIIFGIIALITIYPFYNSLIVSFSNTVTSAKHSPYLLPYVIDWTGYQTIVSDPYFSKSVITTVFVTVVGTALNMVFSIAGAYALSKPKLVGRKFFLTALIFTMLFSGGLIPTYLVVSGLGLTNSIWSMIWPSLINTYYLIIMKNYFASLPPSLEEAAHLDGANDLQVLVKIYLLISVPFMATFALFYSVERWNEWWHAFLYISDKNIKPLQIYSRDMLVNFNSQLATQAQSFMSGQGKVFVQSIQMASIIIAMLPILCIYPFVQKYFVKGIMIGSIKE